MFHFLVKDTLGQRLSHRTRNDPKAKVSSSILAEPRRQTRILSGTESPFKLFRHLRQGVQIHVQDSFLLHRTNALCSTLCQLLEDSSPSQSVSSLQRCHSVRNRMSAKSRPRNTESSCSSCKSGEIMNTPSTAKNLIVCDFHQ